MSVECGGEYPDVRTACYRKARKQHECDACHVAIQPGHRYHYDFVVFEGEAESCKRCMRCDAIYRHLVKVCPNDAFEETTPGWKLNCGHTYEEIHLCAPPPEIAALAFALPGEVQ